MVYYIIYVASAPWIDCFSLNNDIVWNRVFLIIRYVQNTLKDIYIKCYNETYKRITYVHMFILMISKKYKQYTYIDESHDISHSMSPIYPYIHTYLLCIHYNMLLIYGTLIS